MNSIKKAKWIFRLTTVIFMGFVVFGFWKLNTMNKEAEKIYNMPIGEYKILSQKNIADDKDVKVFQYKTIVNANISSEDLKSISESIISKAKNATDINGVEILMYSKPDELKGEPTIAQVIYAPGGNLGRALNEPNANYSQFSYYINPKTSILKQYNSSKSQSSNSIKDTTKQNADNTKNIDNTDKAVENTVKAVENTK
jgi:hypothetical protein